MPASAPLLSSDWFLIINLLVEFGADFLARCLRYFCYSIPASNFQAGVGRPVSAPPQASSVSQPYFHGNPVYSSATSSEADMRAETRQEMQPEPSSLGMLTT